MWTQIQNRAENRGTALVTVFPPVTPARTPLKGKKEKKNFRSKGSEEGQAASLADTAAGTPPLSLRPQEACPLSRLVERAETRAEGGVPAGNEAVRGAGPSAHERERGECREESLRGSRGSCVSFGSVVGVSGRSSSSSLVVVVIFGRLSSGVWSFRRWWWLVRG